jgi:hypothetical protein
VVKVPPKRVHKISTEYSNVTPDPKKLLEAVEEVIISLSRIY